MFFTLVSLALVCAMAVNLSGCATPVQAADLMEGIQANEVTGKELDDAFVNSQMRLAVELFRASVNESKDENVLISPLSIQLALAMTANGAAGKTKAEIESLLGGDIKLEDLNEYLYTYVNSLPSGETCKLQIANSIWFRDNENRLQVEQGFLQRNADYYGAQAHKTPFDAQTLKDINSWVEDHTDGMIDKILDRIEDDAVMYLINALVFDAQWQTVYNKSQIGKGTFTNILGEEVSVDMMHSEEMTYLQDSLATGFMKPYQDGKYSFAALLPNEGVDLYDYISGLTGEGLLEVLNNAQSGTVIATMPKFSYEYDLSMNDALKKLGMPTAFDGKSADFTKMAHSSRGNIYIGDVLHKTFIAVDELGTKAGAVTKVEMNDRCALVTEWVVTLDRPFVYMIIDNETNLPVFIGTVTDLQD
jgi:serpin B